MGYCQLLDCQWEPTIRSPLANGPLGRGSPIRDFAILLEVQSKHKNLIILGMQRKYKWNPAREVRRDFLGVTSLGIQRKCKPNPAREARRGSFRSYPIRLTKKIQRGSSARSAPGEFPGSFYREYKGKSKEIRRAKRAGGIPVMISL